MDVLHTISMCYEKFWNFYFGVLIFGKIKTDFVHEILLCLQILCCHPQNKGCIYQLFVFLAVARSVLTLRFVWLHGFIVFFILYFGAFEYLVCMLKLSSSIIVHCKFYQYKCQLCSDHKHGSSKSIVISVIKVDYNY